MFHAQSCQIYTHAYLITVLNTLGLEKSYGKYVDSENTAYLYTVLGQGKVRQGKARQCKARQGKARQGNVR